MLKPGYSAERNRRRGRQYLSFALLLVIAGCGGSGGGGGSGSGNGGGGTGTAGPHVQYVEPSRVMLGITEGLVTLAGSGFAASDTVLFDGVAATTFYQSTDSVQFEPPQSSWNVAQVHTVQVMGSSLVSNSATYTVYAPATGPDMFQGQLTQYMSEGLLTHSLVQDINGDGKADLILLENPTSPSPTLVARYGQADGTFSAANSLGSFTLQVTPNIVLAGDFSGNGSTDLVLLGQGAYQVLVNDGSGHFTSASVQTIPAWCSVTAVVGDFNHDGKLDFLCGGVSNTQPFLIFLGNGDGSFSAPLAAGAPQANPERAVAADFNRDGYTDVAYLSRFSNGQFQLRILLSTGGGSYTDVPAGGLPSPIVAFTVGDFNNDQTPDLFAVIANGSGQAYLGAGNGTFMPAGRPIFVYDGYLIDPPFVAGDFDHDGNVDVATRTTLSGPDELLFLFGDGAGNFSPQAIASDQSFTLDVGDVNGDGIADIFAGAVQGFGYPSVTLGRNNRDFPSPQILSPQNLGMLSTGNVFNEGFTDLLVSGTSGDGGPPVPGTIYQYQSNGSFGAIGQAPGYSTQLVDLNGDGIADMVGTSGSNLLIWQGNGTGVYQSPVNEIALPGATSPIYFRDMDGDGHMDIVVPGAILYGKGNFQFDAVAVQTTNNFLVGDFDGDGIPDIATSSGVLFGEGNRQFTAPTGTAPLEDNPPAFPTVIAADINRDGKDDIIANDGGDSTISIYLSVGRQGFVLDQQIVIYGYYPIPSSLIVADFNGDGWPDIAGGMLGGDDVVIFTNDGTGKYQITSYAIGVYAVMSVTADVNNDGKPDLAFLNYGFDYKPPAATVLLHK